MKPRLRGASTGKLAFFTKAPGFHLLVGTCLCCGREGDGTRVEGLLEGLSEFDQQKQQHTTQRSLPLAHTDSPHTSSPSPNPHPLPHSHPHPICSALLKPRRWCSIWVLNLCVQAVPHHLATKQKHCPANQNPCYCYGEWAH